jgi:poly-beta-1,6-N-acetyl-D-glucosamine synthase
MTALTIVFIAVLVLGANTLFWTVVGLSRLAVERLRLLMFGHREKTAFVGPGHRFGSADVAVLIPAHNEAAVLEESLRTASALVPLTSIHVVSDGSTDHTADIAAKFGVHVLELSPNRGKAGALVAAIERFKLERLFKVVLLLDADTRLSADYLATGLPLFDDAGVVAVAGRVRCLLDPPPRTAMGRFLVAYRSRVYAVTQLLVKYGQAARWANVVTIVPGFASMYRTDVLSRIDIAAPGLVIEDFNMTFEVHAKNLGRIVFHPNAAVAYTQDPDTARDYLNQIRRWTLGYWQTVRRHKLHLGRFWAALTAQVVELITSSVILLVILPSMLFAIYSDTLAHRFGNPTLMGLEMVGTLAPHYVAFGFLLPDLVLTVFAAIALRQSKLLLLAPLFPIMRIVDAYVCLRAIQPSKWRTHHSGHWVSPTRRKTPSHSLSAGTDHRSPHHWKGSQHAHRHHRRCRFHRQSPHRPPAHRRGPSHRAGRLLHRVAGQPRQGPGPPPLLPEGGVGAGPPHGHRDHRRGRPGLPPRRRRRCSTHHRTAAGEPAGQPARHRERAGGGARHTSHDGAGLHQRDLRQEHRRRPA